MAADGPFDELALVVEHRVRIGVSRRVRRGRRSDDVGEQDRVRRTGRRRHELLAVEEVRDPVMRLTSCRRHAADLGVPVDAEHQPGDVGVDRTQVVRVSSETSRSIASPPGRPYHHECRSRPGAGTDSSTLMGNGEPSGPSSKVPGVVSRRTATDWACG